MTRLHQIRTYHQKPQPQRPHVGAADLVKLRTCWRDSVPAACGEGRALAEDSSPQKAIATTRTISTRNRSSNGHSLVLEMSPKVFSSWNRLVPDGNGAVCSVPWVCLRVPSPPQAFIGVRNYQLLPHFTGAMHSNGFCCGVRC